MYTVHNYTVYVYSLKTVQTVQTVVTANYSTLPHLEKTPRYSAAEAETQDCLPSVHPQVPECPPGRSCCKSWAAHHKIDMYSFHSHHCIMFNRSPTAALTPNRHLYLVQLRHVNLQRVLQLTPLHILAYQCHQQLACSSQKA